MKMTWTSPQSVFQSLLCVFTSIGRSRISAIALCRDTHLDVPSFISTTNLGLVLPDWWSCWFSLAPFSSPRVGTSGRPLEKEKSVDDIVASVQVARFLFLAIG